MRDARPREAEPRDQPIEGGPSGGVSLRLGVRSRDALHEQRAFLLHAFTHTTGQALDCPSLCQDLHCVAEIVWDGEGSNPVATSHRPLVTLFGNDGSNRTGPSPLGWKRSPRRQPVALGRFSSLRDPVREADEPAGTDPSPSGSGRRRSGAGAQLGQRHRVRQHRAQRADSR